MFSVTTSTFKAFPLSVDLQEAQNTSFERPAIHLQDLAQFSSPSLSWISARLIQRSLERELLIWEEVGWRLFLRWLLSALGGSCLGCSRDSSRENQSTQTAPTSPFSLNAVWELDKFTADMQSSRTFSYRAFFRFFLLLASEASVSAGFNTERLATKEFYCSVNIFKITQSNKRFFYLQSAVGSVGFVLLAVGCLFSAFGFWMSAVGCWMQLRQWRERTKRTNLNLQIIAS